MNRKPAEVAPAALPIDDALRDSAPLARLRERLDDSQRRFAAIHDLLPVSLASQVSAGPVDEASWTLLADNSAVASKLRQLQPRFERRLMDRGWPIGATRVRVRSA